MIRMLEESEGNILGFQAGGKLSASDYVKILTPAIERAVTEHERVRVLLYFDETFEGWEAKALWEDAKYVRYMGDFEKLAIVGGPGWVHGMAHVFRPFFKGDVKTFPGAELVLAWAWIRS